MSALGQKRTFKRLLDMLVSAPGRMLKLAGITMKLPRRKFLTWALVPAAAALVEVPRIDAWSQSARSIRVVMPFAPGGPADAMAACWRNRSAARSCGCPLWVKSRHRRRYN